MSAEIPEIGFKKQIPIKEIPYWLSNLRHERNSELEIHKSTYQTRSGLEIYKLKTKYVIVSHYAPLRITEAFIVEVCDETRKDEHVQYDLHAEHLWEREQDMLADARMEAYEDREPEDFDSGWY